MVFKVFLPNSGLTFHGFGWNLLFPLFGRPCHTMELIFNVLVSMKCWYSHYRGIKKNNPEGCIKLLFKWGFCYRQGRLSGSRLYQYHLNLGWIMNIIGLFTDRRTQLPKDLRHCVFVLRMTWLSYHGSVRLHSSVRSLVLSYARLSVRPSIRPSKDGLSVSPGGISVKSRCW